VSPPSALSPIGGNLGGGLKFPRHQSHVARTQMHWHTPNAYCRLRVGQHECLNFVRCGRNFTKFFCSTLKGPFSSTPFRFCCYLYRFQRYLRSNSKVVVKCTKFWTFLPSQISRGVVPPNVVLALTPQPRNTSRAKVSSGYTTSLRSYKCSFIAF